MNAIAAAKAMIETLRQKGILAALLTLLVGAMLSALTFAFLVELEEDRERADFAITAEQHFHAIADRLSRTIEAVQSIAALFAASETVTRAEFSKFSKIELRDQPNIQALEWIPRVKASERVGFESRARKDGMRGFAITERHAQGDMVPAGRREAYFPVYFVEPLKGNEAALGFDLASNPARLAAINAARDTGKIRATARITLVQETGKSYGLLVFQPIYRGGDVPATVAERREKLEGFGLGVLRISETLRVRKKNAVAKQSMETFIFDRSAPPGQQILFPVGASYQTRTDLTREGCVDHPMEVAGRPWVSVHCPPETYVFLANHFASTAILAAGLLITAMLAFYLRALAKQGASTRRFVQRLQASETRYSDIVDNANILIQSVDVQSGKLIFVNTAWSSTLGYDFDEASELTFFDILDPESHEHCREVLQQAVSSRESTETTARFLTKTGKIIDVKGAIVCREDEAGALITHGVFSDITELNRVHREHERVAIELTQLIDTANAPIFGVDIYGHINEWNQMAARITGYDKDEVMHCSLVDEFIEPEYKQSMKQILDAALKGQETANYEFSLRTKSGGHVDVLLNATSRRNAEGNIVGVVGIGQDITARKDAEAQVIQASKLATLGEMATSVAHELNQPLSVIRMAAGNTLRTIRKGNADPEYLTEKLERITAQTVRATSIIDHMRMFGRKASEEPSRIDPRKFVEGALNLIGEQLRLADIEIDLNLPETCPSILGHQIQAEQVMINLLTNARDAINSPAGAGERRITLRVKSGDGETVRIIVEDTGGGIPGKIIDRIFEPFYTSKEVGEGTGLGLSVSYGIIRDMGGTIEASNTGQGARFEITLPIAKISAAGGETGETEHLRSSK